MVDITTATVSPFLLTTWDIPPGSQVGLQPRGEAIATGLATIPALGASDENLWTLQMDFPRNFHYRLVEASMNAVSDSVADLEDPQNGMRVLVSSDAPGFAAWSFFMAYDQLPNGTDAPDVVARVNFASVTTDDSFSSFHSVGPIDGFIDAANGAARLLSRWLNLNPTTAAIDMSWRFRALVYDQDQVRKFPVHTPTPIIGA